MAEQHQRPARRSLFTLRRWVAFGFVLWLGSVGVLLLDAMSSLDRARDRVDRAVPLAKNGEIEAVRAELGPGAADLRRARDALFHPVLLPLRPLPVIGRQLRTARSLAQVGAETATEAEQLIALVDAPTSGEGATLRSIDLAAIAASLERMHELVSAPDLGPSEGLVAPLADARSEVAELIERYEPSIGAAADVAAGVRSFEEGSRYVLLGANNAEMQVGGGMILSIGEVELADGGVEFTGLESTEELFPVPEGHIVDADVEQRWGFLRPTNDFRKLGLTPRFSDFVGPQAMAMWQAETDREVDGAIFVDAHALSRLLGTVGPVEIDGETFTEERLLRYLLQDQYAAYGPSEAEQAQRRAKLAAVTSGVLDALVAGPHDMVSMVEVIPSLIRGRHLLIYGDKPVEQRGWEALGVDAASSGRDVGVFVVNMGASKLDPYLDVDVRIQEAEIGNGNSAEPSDPGSTTFDMTVTIANGVTEGERLPSYVVGPWEWIDVDEPGEYLGRLVVTLPASTSAAEFVSDVPLEVFGPDGDGVLVGTRFAVRPGRSTTIRLRFEVPDAVESVTILPSARPRPVQWQWGDVRFDDAERRDQSLHG